MTGAISFEIKHNPYVQMFVLLNFMTSIIHVILATLQLPSESHMI